MQRRRKEKGLVAGREKRRRRARWALRLTGVGVLVVGLAVAGREWFLPFAARWLSVSDPLASSDLIVVLGGDGERVEEGVRLYREGYGQKVLFTSAVVPRAGEEADPDVQTPKVLPRKSDLGIIHWPSELKRVLNRGAIPSSALLLDATAASTCAEARLIDEVMETRGARSAIVVSSPYHMRRIQWIFRRLLGKPSHRVLLHPVLSSWFREDDWWTHRRGIETLVSEYVKLLYAMATC